MSLEEIICLKNCLHFSLYYAKVCVNTPESPHGDTECKGSSDLHGQRKAPLLQDAEVVFPSIHEECFVKEEAMDYLGEKVCVISRELTFS